VARVPSGNRDSRRAIRRRSAEIGVPFVVAGLRTRLVVRNSRVRTHYTGHGCHSDRVGGEMHANGVAGKDKAGTEPRHYKVDALLKLEPTRMLER